MNEEVKEQKSSGSPRDSNEFQREKPAVILNIYSMT